MNPLAERIYASLIKALEDAECVIINVRKRACHVPGTVHVWLYPTDLRINIQESGGLFDKAPHEIAAMVAEADEQMAELIDRIASENKAFQVDLSRWDDDLGNKRDVDVDQYRALRCAHSPQPSGLGM